MGVNAAVVLAAGEGRRLRPLTAYRPKPMLPAANRPILRHVLDAVVDAGVDDLHLVVGYGRDRVQNYFGPSYRDRPVTYHHQESQLGTGHALLAAADAVEAETLVVNGDELTATGMITDVVAGHGPDAAATVGVTERARIDQYGAVRLDDDAVTGIVERPSEGTYRYVNAGVYVVTPALLPFVERTATVDGELHLPDALDAAATDRHGAVRGVPTRGILSNVTYPWDLLGLVETLAVDGRLPEPERSPGVHVAETARVHDDATLRAPTVLGPDVTVHPGAVVGPQAALGRGVSVGANAVVAHSVVDEGATVGPGATTADTVVGPDARVGAGVTVCGGPGDVRVGTTVHEDAPLGGVVADRATVGGGATVTAGALVGPDSRVATGAVVDDDVPADAEVRR
jgi:glucose-1-phosphate thymidylyltransferase